MDYKEKYDKLVESIKVLQESNPSDEGIQNWVKDNVPELEESGDEKIRKELIKHLRDGAEGYIPAGGSEDYTRWLTWLEKQGEPKDANKVEPKFHEGDIIKPKNGYRAYCQIIQVDVSDRKYRFDDGYVINFSQEDAFELVKRQPTDKTKPKFKVGDKVRMKEFESFPHICTVEDVDSDVYYCDFTNFDIDDQDGWELVKEPKFKVGDFIVNDYCMGRVVEITNDAYLLDTGQGIPFSCEHNAHLWSIEDAKDGDVLTAYECYVIFKEIDGLNIKCHCAYHYMGLNPSFYINTLQNKTAFHPATKEECEQLYKKMTEAGYTWDAYKKELKKIEFDPDNLIEESYQQQAEDLADIVTEKSTWSEEDEEDVIYALETILDLLIDPEACIGLDEVQGVKNETMKSWLKSIKNRVQHQQKQKWTEEDEKKRKLLISVLEVNHPNGRFKVNPTNTTDMEAISTEELVDWLKYRVQPQQKQKWTEEDDNSLENILYVIKVAKRNIITPEDLRNIWCAEDWLEKLKKRLQTLGYFDEN